MDSLFQNDMFSKSASNIPAAESPWIEDVFAKWITPNTSWDHRTALRDTLLPQRIMDGQGVSELTDQVVQWLERDGKYGAPLPAQVSIHDGLVDSITFPNNGNRMDIMYSDRDSGKIWSLRMNDRSVTFDYDPRLRTIIFSGDEYKDSIFIDPDFAPSVARSGDKQIVCDPRQLAREVLSYLRK